MTTELTAEHARHSRAGSRAPAGMWPPPRAAWLPAASVGLLFAAHWFYGALVSDAALIMGMAAAGLLIAVLLQPWLRDDLLRLRGLAAPAVLFAAVIGVGLWSLTPWTPGGPHPAWAYVGVQPGASSIDKSATLIEILKLLGLACIFLVGAATGARDERARYAIRLTIIAGVLFGLWAFFGAVTGTVYQTGGRRLEGHFVNPNTAGTFFAVLLILAVGELARKAGARPGRRELSARLPAAAAALTFAVCLLDTASRGAVLAFLGASGVFIAVRLASGALRPSRALLATGGALALLVAVVWIAGDPLVERFFHSSEDAIVRGDIWNAHWQAFLASPLFGYGLGSAETVNKTLLTAANYPLLWNIKAILNLYLQWLEEAGLAGALPMFLSVAALVASVVRGTLRRNHMTRLLAALLAADAVFILHGATDFGLQVPSLAAFWAWLLGLQFSLAQGSSRR